MYETTFNLIHDLGKFQSEVRHFVCDMVVFMQTRYGSTRMTLDTFREAVVKYDHCKLVSIDDEDQSHISVVIKDGKLTNGELPMFTMDKVSNLYNEDPTQEYVDVDMTKFMSSMSMFLVCLSEELQKYKQRKLMEYVADICDEVTNRFIPLAKGTYKTEYTDDGVEVLMVFKLRDD